MTGESWRWIVVWVVAIATASSLQAEPLVFEGPWVTTQLTHEAWHEAYPVFSPDGSKIAYIGVSGTGGDRQDRLYIVNSDGTDPQQLTFRNTDNGSFTLDGQYFLSTGPDPSATSADIWKTKVDGTSDVRLWETSLGEGLPSQLYDGRIVFQCSMDGIWIADADGSNAHRLTSAGNRQQPRVWSSADAAYITYMSQDGNGNPYDIFLYDLQTNVERQITSLPGDASVPQGYPSFSPDGKWIVYQSKEDGGPNYDIWVTDVSTGTQRFQLTNDATMDSSYPQFDPAYADGSRIVYTSNKWWGDANADLWEARATSGMAAVPEPFSLAFMGCAFAGVVGWGLRRRAKQRLSGL